MALPSHAATRLIGAAAILLVGCRGGRSGPEQEARSDSALTARTWGLAYLQQKGIRFDRRLEHGMTHSLYIHDPNGYGIEFVYDLPKEIWQDDIDGALNWARALPTEGPEAIEDRTEGLPTFNRPAPSTE